MIFKAYQHRPTTLPQSTTDRITGWHRLFGLLLCDVFTNTPYQVELEKDLTVKQQFLDVIIIRQDKTTLFDTTTLPDGLDNLKQHNLLTYKSFQESLDAFAIDELIGHSVNYQKQVEQRFDVDDMQLYAISTRYPEKLLKTVKPAANPKQGIYDLKWGRHTVRVVVLKRIETHPRNAAWDLFSAEVEKIRHGAQDYQWKQPQATVMQQLYRYYELEEWIQMPYTYEQFEKEFKQEIKHEIFQEFKDEFFQEYKDDFLQQYTTEERLRDLPAEERLQGLSKEELEKMMLWLKKKTNDA